MRLPVGSGSFTVLAIVCAVMRRGSAVAALNDRDYERDCEGCSIDKEGVGLGLYIVKTILNNHKENITVTSKDGITEFIFTLTLAG